MTVVVDVGAARHDDPNFDAYSMERLIDEYRPSHLYAYDPSPALALPDPRGTKVVLVPAAAWTYKGTVGYTDAGAWSHLTDASGAPQVPCVDLADELAHLSARHQERMVLKLDCEGAEYMLLPHLIARDADLLLDVTLVEWHPYELPYARSDHALIRAAVEATARCELKEWWF